jgi:hypothetical protein
MHALSCNESCNGHAVRPIVILAAQFKLLTNFDAVIEYFYSAIILSLLTTFGDRSAL